VAEKAYQQTGGYMPQTDAGFQAWLFNFSSLIQQDWSRYSLTEADSLVISGHYAAYNPLYQQCQQPSVRTTSLLQQKDAVKASAMASCRVYAQIVKNSQGVDAQDKAALGLHVNDVTPSPIPAPSSAPLLNIVAAFSGQHEIRYADENTPSSRKKPAGVTQLELYVHVGAQPTVNWEDATFVGVYTKNPIQYTFTPAQAGQVATYFARWRTTRGLAGPMSLGVGMIIAFGGPVQQSSGEELADAA